MKKLAQNFFKIALLIASLSFLASCHIFKCCKSQCNSMKNSENSKCCNDSKEMEKCDCSKNCKDREQCKNDNKSVEDESTILKSDKNLNKADSASKSDSKSKNNSKNSKKSLKANSSKESSSDSLEN